MRKVVNFVVIIIFAIFIAGIYGIIHDQITYSISYEYYTHFKFEQFGINEWEISNERAKVAIIGFLATWWVGLFLGFVYALFSLFLSKKKLKIFLKAILLNVFIALVCGIVGYFYAAWFVEYKNINYHIPFEVKDKYSFINVGSIHNFSYIGGIIGLIFGIYYIVKQTLNLEL